MSDINEKRLLEYMDIAGSFIICLNRDQKITYINKRGAELLEREVDDVIGEDYFDLCVEEGRREITRERFIKLFSKPLIRPNNFEGKIVTATGNERVINWTNSALRDDNGKIVEIISSGNDITWRIDAIKKIVESKKKYEALIEATDTGYSIVDEKGCLLEVNEKYVDLLGADEIDAIIGEKVSTFVAPHHKQLYEESITFCQTMERVNHFEIDLLRSDGTLLPVQMSSRCVRKSSGTTIITLCRDISERRRIEHEAKLHEQQLIQADKMASLGVLVSGVAHEINNPNNFMMLNIPILQGIWNHVKPILENHYEEKGDFLVGKRLRYSAVRGTVSDLLDGVYDGSKRIENIVRELKDYARLNEEESSQLFSIDEVINTAYMLSSNLIKRSTQNFLMKLDGNLPKMRGNFQKIEQVIINLLQNSCHALDDGEKGLIVESFFDENSGMVNCRIIDEGVGMDEETLKQIRDPFFTTKRGRGGTGLGLAVSSKIVSNHGGRMEFFSKPDEGTTVVLSFPVV